MLLNSDNQIIVGKGIQLKPYTPRAYLPRQYMTENEIRQSAGGDIILDVECFINYYMAGFKHVRSNKYIRLDGDFNPYFLSWILNSFRSVGFNSITFDFILLWASYVNRSPSFLKAVANALIQQGKRKEEVEKEFGFKCYPLQPRQHIDLFNVCPLKGSLKLYGARLHSPRIQDLPFSQSEPLDNWQIPVVQEYNCNDLDVTEQIFKFCKERLELRESISLEYNLDLMSKSDAQMAEAVISQEVSKLNGRYVKRPEIDIGHTFKYRCPQYIRFATPQMQKLLERVKRINFEVDHDGRIASPKELDEPAIIGNNKYVLGIGGLHSKDKCKAYEAKNGWKLKDIDVRSYYPNAIINLELMPTAMGPNFLIIYKGFKLSREEAKAKKLFTKDKGLKIFLNGVSGKWSDPFSKMYSPWNTIHMNLTGQLLILMLAEMLTCQGMEIVSANTDGLVVYYKEEDEEKLKYWIKYWEDMTGFVLEDADYVKYYARDVNAYFAVKDDGTTKVKGPYSEVGSQSGTQLDNNPNMLICSDAIKKFLSSGVPIEQTIMNCKDISRFVVVRNVKGGAHKDGHYLGKVVRFAYYKKCYGTINYILSGNKVPDTEGATPLQDLPAEFPADQIDHQYYINAAKEILTDIGYYHQAKQVAFF
jgi:hypothetical protein